MPNNKVTVNIIINDLSGHGGEVPHAADDGPAAHHV